MSILERIRKSLLRMGSSTISNTMKLSFTLLKCFSSPSLETSAAIAADNIMQQQDLDNILQNIVPSLSFHELEVATDGFSSSDKIGEGGFGSVYKGRLGDENMVAIKVLAANSRQGHNEFMSEIASLSKISHGNLVRLLGVCIEGPCRILVYNYMENNSLAHILLGGEETRAKLCWKARTEISLGIAQGLAYIHEEVKPNIVHRDIKASNILLDRNFVPKLSDFGLSKLFPENVTHISTEVAGTLGYLAPEYAMSGRLTREVDVYGFGVLLLEITSGRKAIDFDIELGEHCLAEKAWKLHRANRLLELVDPVLNGKFRGEEALLFMKVALLCVQEKSELRPSMSMALKTMRGQVNINSMKITHPGLITDIMNVKISPRHRSHI